jgi:hypothetical protein
MVSWLSADQKVDSFTIYFSVIIPAKRGVARSGSTGWAAGNEAVMLNDIAGDGFETRPYPLASRADFDCGCARLQLTNL